MKALGLGIAGACVAGLLSGGAMKLGPNALAERPLGPQILISGPGHRAIDNNGWYADPVLIGYDGEIPDYVLGTDWLRPAPPDEAYITPVSEVEEPQKAPPPNTLAVYTRPVVKVAKPPRPVTISYPGMDGDIVGEAPPDSARTVEIETTPS